jgi:hypothetical protein
MVKETVRATFGYRKCLSKIVQRWNASFIKGLRLSKQSCSATKGEDSDFVRDLVWVSFFGGTRTRFSLKFKRVTSRKEKKMIIELCSLLFDCKGVDSEMTAFIPC